FQRAKPRYCLPWRPCARSEVGAAMNTRSPATRSPGKARVLIIDDDEGLGTLLTEYLGQFGFAVRAAAHPDEGLRLLKTEPPDILVLDVMLPDMDGFAVCRKIREVSRVPIV